MKPVVETMDATWNADVRSVPPNAPQERNSTAVTQATAQSTIATSVRSSESRATSPKRPVSRR